MSEDLTKTDSPQFELVSSGEAIEALTRGEVDSQIATAKKYPRSLTQFIKQATEMVTMDSDIAASCFYKLKRRNADGSDNWIDGESVRLAEITASAFKNIRYAARIIAIEEKAVVAQGVCIDLENNVAHSSEVRRRITTRGGQRFGDDMINVTCMAAIAIAGRNAIYKVVPKALLKPVIDAAKKCAMGDMKTLPDRRSKALGYFESIGVKSLTIFAFLGVKGIEDIGLEQLELLTGIKTAIADKEMSVEEAFANPTQSVGDVLKTVSFGKGKEPSKTSKSAPEPAVKGISKAESRVESSSTAIASGSSELLKEADKGKLKGKDIGLYAAWEACSEEDRNTASAIFGLKDCSWASFKAMEADFKEPAATKLSQLFDVRQN